MSTSSMTAALLIVALLHDTPFVQDYWKSLTAEDREAFWIEWAALIRANPRGAAEEIIDALVNHPILSPGWQQLGEVDSTCVGNKIRDIVYHYDPTEEHRMGWCEIPDPPWNRGDQG